MNAIGGALNRKSGEGPKATRIAAIDGDRYVLESAEGFLSPFTLAPWSWPTDTGAVRRRSCRWMRRPPGGADGGDWLSTVGM